MKNKPAGRPPKTDKSLKESLLDAAVSLFARTGVANTSIKDVGVAGGATPAMVYYYFKSKEDLVEEVISARFLPIVSEIWHFEEGEFADPLGMTAGLQKRLIEKALALPWFLPLWSREIFSENGVLRNHITKFVDSLPIRRFIGALRQGQQDGTINKDILPEMMFMSLIGATMLPMLTGKTWESILHEPIEMERIALHASSLILNGIRPA